ncbi:MULTISPECIES: polymer-forming cytoskeletal protein [Halobacterium]|uniref:polymer-forming cytoskeletal protein n=1 Tax=Halobacterium TaxID=2239 RepID=UPI001962955A|nr:MULTISPECIES: polymer-forming cytoskeletal protein [Halobacterium]MCF2164038.1 acyltransferase [Halobacterium salinarum]MCF2168768.1 acyltransferase [Halobacterium salinarum]MCF2239743.1 acyltransferase [Halobacterium salinarum]MDL0127527.1 acyltransferase [Halobacterium salinarum]QRY23090.1 acyltransferase [Halobacterium sp. GSL-19]
MPMRRLDCGVLGPTPIDQLHIPDGTTVKEHDVVADSDVLIGAQSQLRLGVRGHNVVAGERVSVDGDIEAAGDCRLDMWCEVTGNVLVEGDAYVGERTHITERLVVGGDLDIGDDVDIEEGFEASGWIVIRNPMPTLTFFVMYLTHLLRLGEAEDAQELVEELAADGDRGPLTIPQSASVSDDAWRVSTPATIGDDCRLHGNIRATEIDVGRGNNVFGSLRAQNDVTVGAGTKIHGDVTTRNGSVHVQGDAVVLGDVSGHDVTIDEAADVDGVIRARGEMRLGSVADRDAE